MVTLRLASLRFENYSRENTFYRLLILKNVPRTNLPISVSVS